MSKPIIIGIGEIVWDCLLNEKTLGGAPINFVHHCKQLGADSHPITAIGDDELGVETLLKCNLYNIDTNYIQVNQLPTSKVIVEIDSNGIPSYKILDNVAWDSLNVTSDALSLASKTDVVCWGTIAQRSEQSRNSINKIIDIVPNSSLKVFDINLRQNYYNKDIIESSLNKANILKLNEDELPIVMNMFGFSNIDEIIKKYSLKYLIYTCGDRYSEIYYDGLVSHIDTPKVDVVDTVGAGDSFTASFIMSILNNNDIVTAHNNAVKIAAKVCTMKGAI